MDSPDSPWEGSPPKAAWEAMVDRGIAKAQIGEAAWAPFFPTLAEGVAGIAEPAPRRLQGGLDPLLGSTSRLGNSISR